MPWLTARPELAPARAPANSHTLGARPLNSENMPQTAAPPAAMVVRFLRSAKWAMGSSRKKNMKPMIEVSVSAPWMSRPNVSWMLGSSTLNASRSSSSAALRPNRTMRGVMAAPLVSAEGR